MSSLSCPICHRQFTTRYSMKRHYIRIHPKVEIPEYLSPKFKDTMKCAMCESVLHNLNDLECHLLSHKIVLESEILTFENETEFYSWKTRLEEAEKVQYVKNTGKRVSTNNIITNYYTCHRSGSYKPMVSSIERKRQLKIQGSSKINAFCPSRIKATFQTDGKVLVEFRSKHLGHSNDLAHLNSCHDVKLKFGLSADKNQFNSYQSSRLGDRTINLKNIIPTENDFRKIKFRHKMSLKMKTDSVVECVDDSDDGPQPAWSVGSEEEQKCRVKSLKTVCDCPLFCKYCKACSHKYSCTCPDASVKGNLCKHIHLVCRVSNLKGNVIEHNKSNTFQIEDGPNCEAIELVYESNLLKCVSDQLDCEVNHLECITDQLACEANQLKDVSDQFNCQSDQFNCQSGQLNCETNQLNCEADQLNCEANQLNCEPDQLNCVSDQLNCGSDQLNCGSDQLNCEMNQLNCEVGQLNCEVDQLHCEADQLNCETNQLNFDPNQLNFEANQYLNNCEVNSFNCHLNQLDYEENQLNCKANQINCEANQLNFEENQLNYDTNQLIFDDFNQNNVTLVVEEPFDAKKEIFDEFKTILEAAKTQQEINLLKIGVRGLKAFIETIGITQDQGIQLPKFDSNSNKDDSVIQFMII